MHGMHGMQKRMRDAGCRMRDAGYRMPVAGYRMPDVGFFATASTTATLKVRD